MTQHPQERPSIGLSIEEQWEQWQAEQPDEETSPEDGPDEEGQTQGGLLSSTTRGVARGVNNIAGLANSFVKAGSRMSGLYKLGRDEDEEREWLETYEEHSTATPFNVADRPGGLWGFYEAAVQFAVPFAAVSRNIQIANTLGRAAVAGAVTDFAVFDPHEERLSNLVENGPEWLSNPVTEFLASDEEDHWALGRFKNTLEGVLLGTTIDALASGVRYTRIKQRVRSGKMSEEEGAEAIQNIFRTPEGLKEGPRDAQAPDVRRTTPAEESMLAKPKDEPFRIEQNEDGTVSLIGKENSTFKIGEDVPARMEFETRLEAERAAASLNMVHRLNAKPQDFHKLGAAQRTAVKTVQDRIDSGVDPTDFDRLTFGVDFNFGRVDTDDEALGLLNALSEALRPIFKDRTNRASEGGGQTWEETRKLADGIIAGVTPDEFIEHLRAISGVTEVLPQTVMAARMMLHGYSQRVAKISRSVDLDPTNGVAVRQMAEEMDRLGNLAIQTAGIGSDIGRALNAMKIQVDEDALRAAKEAAEDSAETVPLKTSRTKAGFTKAVNTRRLTAREVAAMARSLTMARGDAHSTLRVLRLGARRLGNPEDKSLWDKLVSFRASFMLSGLRTQFVNFTSSTLTAFQVPAEVYLGGLRSGDKEMTKQGLDMLTSPFTEGGYILKEAVNGMRESWTQRRSVLDPRFVKDERGVQTAFQPDDIKNSFFLRVLDLPGRALTSSDEFVKRMAYLSHVRSQSLRAVRKEGLENGVPFTPKQVEARVYDDMAHSVDEGGEALWYNSLEHARTTTFTNKLHEGTVGKSLQDMADNNVGVRLILPFVRTPVNLFNFAHQRTPGLNRLNKEWREMIAAGGEQAAIAKGRSTMGLLGYSFAAFLSASDLMTGGGPSNPHLRRQMIDAGWQPYSVRIGNSWVSYRRLEPISTPLAIVADLWEFAGELNEPDLERAAMATMAAMTATVTSKSYLMGLADFFEAVSSRRPNSMQRLGHSVVTSFTTPALLRQGNPDELWREAGNVVEAVKQSAPGFSNTLEPRRNIFGEPVVKTARQTFMGYANQSFNPFTVINADDIDDIQKELADLGRSITLPKERLNDGRINLRDGQRWMNDDPERIGQSPYDRMMELVQNPPAGQSLREMTAGLMRSETWDNLSSGTDLFPGGTKHRLINELVRKSHQAAYVRMLEEYPDLKAAIQGDLKASVEALVGTN